MGRKQGEERRGGGKGRGKGERGEGKEREKVGTTVYHSEVKKTLSHVYQPRGILYKCQL